MTTHSTQKSMLRESLTDMLNGAKICIEYDKSNGGCLGYPACLLLLCVADTIASYHEGDTDFEIKVEGENRMIKSNGYQRFYIFNSSYYNLTLRENFIKKIYENYRSLLVHNGTLANKHFLSIDHPLRLPFDESGFQNELTGEKYPSVSLRPLWMHSAIAVTKFLKDVDKILEKSKISKNIDKKN